MLWKLLVSLKNHKEKQPMYRKLTVLLIAVSVALLLCAGTSFAGDSSSYSGQSDIDVKSSSIDCPFGGTVQVGSTPLEYVLVSKYPSAFGGATCCYKVKVRQTYLTCEAGKLSDIKKKYQYRDKKCNWCRFGPPSSW
jgi:hypothetical protein